MALRNWKLARMWWPHLHRKLHHTTPHVPSSCNRRPAGTAGYREEGAPYEIFSEVVAAGEVGVRAPWSEGHSMSSLLLLQAAAARLAHSDAQVASVLLLQTASCRLCEMNTGKDSVAHQETYYVLSIVSHKHAESRILWLSVMCC